MFDFLKGGQATLRVTLDRADKIYHAGETVHATVEVQGVKDLKIQNARIALVSREEYERRYEETSTDSDGSTSRDTVKQKQTDERPVWQHQFLGETTIKGSSSQSFSFDIPIPADALPTVEGGKILNYAWLVKTVLDRRLRGDVEDKQELYLLATPSNKPALAGEFGSSNEPGDALLSLRLSSTDFQLGDTITGELVIQPQKEFDVTEIRVELELIENVPQDEGNTFKDKQTVKLASSTHLTLGQNLNLPFQLKIPTGVPITCRTPHGSINWVLRGVLSRRMRGDTLVEQAITLSDAR